MDYLQEYLEEQLKFQELVEPYASSVLNAFALKVDLLIRSKLMNFEAYEIGADSTAKYPDRGNNPLYATLGLRGEIGEISEKLKKELRDKTIFNNILFAKELGDFLWYARATLYELNFITDNISFKLIFPDINSFDDINNDNEYLISKYDFLENMDWNRAHVTNYLITLKVFKSNSQFLDLRNHFKVMLESWAGLCRLVGYEPNEVAQMNLDKLADRKERNVLSGSGDTR